MRARLRQLEGRVLSRGWADLARQLLAFGLAYGLYEVVRGLTGAGAAGRATADATRVIELERRVHLFVEPGVQAWALHVPALLTIADLGYLDAHGLVTAAVLIYLYVRRPDRFGWARDSLLIGMAIALVGYLVFPTAPPRLMPHWGFVDAIRRFSGIDAEHGPGSVLLNPDAAIPSMHVCFALVCGGAMSRAGTRRAVRAAWAAYPVLVALVVIVTANHYLVDIALGAATAGLSMTASGRLRARGRADVWAFDEATA